ncbi:MAG: tRNA (adenosine(37)-N6)-threonylcarbamoyltransferase complex ATPase subunit type 1 TsaE [Clostridiales Family XIII bacterium]|jgi:tRNA threonylcarbamoyladenosine biosynthesis protein TsaE|nr:tRNA (adenosine(37)-N6)-threonylcarbamoyltransferase complex ATPase subunit type 1 TsaE [Clostridiales Family XIII bacterium]
MNENANTITLNEQELRAYGRALGESLEPGAVLALVGDLGAGKTTLTKAIAEGLGIEEPVTSPTFTLIGEYAGGRLPLYHFDVYRIDDPDEMNVLGYEEYFYGNGLTVVEWADKIWELLPADAIVIELSYGKNENERILRKRNAK